MIRIHYPPPIQISDQPKPLSCRDYLLALMDACPDLGKGAYCRALHAAIHEAMAGDGPYVDLPEEFVEVLKSVVRSAAVPPAIGRLVVAFDASVLHAEPTRMAVTPPSDHAEEGP